MVDGVRDVLAGIATVEKMTVAFQDEDHCRQLLEALVWPRGRICPACSYRCSTALAGRDIGWRARPGLIGASPRRDADRPRLGRGRKGQPRTTKTPVLAVVQRPEQLHDGVPAGAAGARVVDDLSEREAWRVLSKTVDPSAHLMSDEWKSFMSVGQAFAAHDTVRHCDREYARGPVHANSVEGFNDRVRRIIAGVFHHISSHHADLYFNEIGFRWSQRVMTGTAVRRTHRGREVVKPLWRRIPPALQLSNAFKSAVGRQLRRTAQGGHPNPMHHRCLWLIMAACYSARSMASPSQSIVSMIVVLPR